MVIRWDVCEFGAAICFLFAYDTAEGGCTLGLSGATEGDTCAVRACCGDFGWGTDCRHYDVGGDVVGAGCEGESLGVVPWKRSFGQGMVWGF